jgi:hypothetical protein
MVTEAMARYARRLEEPPACVQLHRRDNGVLILAQQLLDRGILPLDWRSSFLGWVAPVDVQGLA